MTLCRKLGHRQQRPREGLCLEPVLSPARTAARLASQPGVREVLSEHLLSE